MNKISLAASEFVEEQIGLLGRTGWGEADARIYTPAKTEVGKSVRAKGRPAPAPKAKKGIIPLFFATDDNYLCLLYTSAPIFLCYACWNICNIATLTAGLLLIFLAFSANAFFRGGFGRL